MDRNRIRHTDGVCNLNLTSFRKTSPDHIPCDLSRNIRTTAIHLARILTPHSPSADMADTAICVADELAACYAAICKRSANLKLPSRIYQNLEIPVQGKLGSDIFHQFANPVSDVLL